MEPAYDTVIAAARTLWGVQGIKFKISGVEHVPVTGPGVVAINHTGYLDFTLAGIPAFLQGKRKVRFMAKKEVFDNKISGPIMRSLRHIPVDRTAGADSYRAAVDYLKAGELVGVYPEATISRALVLKDFKSGAARMALEAQVPIIPCIVWGAHRVWTKDHPKQLGRNKIPFTVRYGTALPPVGTPTELDAALKQRMSAMLDEVQRSYPHPAGQWWVPQSLGGSAPALEEARKLDEAELAARARRATEHH